MRLNFFPKFGGKGYDTTTMLRWLFHVVHHGLSVEQVSGLSCMRVLWPVFVRQLQVTPGDLLFLLRWTMAAVESYFCAINVKGRRWIPRPEAIQLAQKCHDMTDPWHASVMHACACALKRRVQRLGRLGRVEEVEAFQA